MEITPALCQAIMGQYQLRLEGIHGLSHWARVYENGLRLASETGARQDVVQLFAVLHDACRKNDSYDCEHGPRAAKYTRKLRGNFFELDEAGMDLLETAIREHTSGKIHADVTVNTCWDSDRLDLGRVGITPAADKLCTLTARDPKMIEWAEQRSRRRAVPKEILMDWGFGQELSKFE